MAGVFCRCKQMKLISAKVEVSKLFAFKVEEISSNFLKKKCSLIRTSMLECGRSACDKQGQIL